MVGLMTKDVHSRLEERGITFELTSDANLWLGKEGYDPVYGARPLRRAVTRYLENPLSKGILSGEYASGDHVIVDAGTDGLALTKMTSQEPASDQSAAESAADEAVPSSS